MRAKIKWENIFIKESLCETKWRMKRVRAHTHPHSQPEPEVFIISAPPTPPPPHILFAALFIILWYAGCWCETWWGKAIANENYKVTIRHTHTHKPIDAEWTRKTRNKNWNWVQNKNKNENNTWGLGQSIDSTSHRTNSRQSLDSLMQYNSSRTAYAKRTTHRTDWTGEYALFSFHFSRSSPPPEPWRFFCHFWAFHFLFYISLNGILSFLRTKRKISGKKARIFGSSES